MYLGQAMGICPGLMNFQTFDTSGTPYYIYLYQMLAHRMIMMIKATIDLIFSSIFL